MIMSFSQRLFLLMIFTFHYIIRSLKQLRQRHQIIQKKNSQQKKKNIMSLLLHLAFDL